MKKINNSHNLNKNSSRLRIVGLCLFLASISILIYYTSKQETNIQAKNSVIIEQDSIIKDKDSIITIIETQMSRKDSILSVVNKFLKFRGLHDVDQLDKLYSDTVNVYFRDLKNCNKQEIKKSDLKFWSIYKNDTFYLKSEPEIILNDSIAKAIIRGNQCKTQKNCSDQILYLKFDTNNKINYVKAYYAE